VRCLQRAARRVSVITLLIVMLITRVQNQWIIAMHRFTEVSIGIAVGLAISAFLAGVQSRASTVASPMTLAPA